MTGSSSSRAELLDAFKKRFGISDSASSGLDVALTHGSYAYETGSRADNERLEFLGDAVLSSVAADYLYHRYPEADEGTLSKYRARLVSRAFFGRRARDMDLGPLLLLGRGERRNQGHERLSVLGSALEAVVGAVYLAEGYDAAREFALKHVLEPLAAELETEPMLDDFKSALQELTQRAGGSLPEYRLIEEEGPGHEKSFTVEVHVDGKAIAQATGSRIKGAENEAARRALEKLQDES